MNDPNELTHAVLNRISRVLRRQYKSPLISKKSGKVIRRYYVYTCQTHKYEIDQYREVIGIVIEESEEREIKK